MRVVDAVRRELAAVPAIGVGSRVCFMRIGTQLAAVVALAVVELGIVPAGNVVRTGGPGGRQYT